WCSSRTAGSSTTWTTRRRSASSTGSRHSEADMLQLTLASVWARRRRLLGTSLAVVLGVAYLTGTLLLGDTISANFDRLFSEVSANTDVVVRNATSTSNEPDANRGLIDESVLGVVRSVDGVQRAEAQVVGYGTL